MALYKNNTSTGELNLLAGSAAVDNKLNKDSSNPVQNKIITTKIDELEKSFTEAKKSVSDGKSKVASAITDKGVVTLATDTFDVIAENVGKIQTGISLTQVIETTMTTSNCGGIKTIVTHTPYIE